MLRGIFLSFILHVFVILLIIYVLPDFFTKNKRDIEITVDIVSIDELIPPQYIATKTIQKKTKKITKATKDDDKIREKKKLKKIPKLVPIIKPKDTKKAKIGPLKKKSIKKSATISLGSGKDKKSVLEDSDFEGVLEEIKRVQKAEVERIYREEYIYGKGLTPTEKHNIRNQINSCWNNIVKKLFSKEEIIGIKVKVIVSLDKDGRVLGARLADSTKQYMQLDNFLYRQVADSALSTFYRCKNIFHLPKNKYEYWKELEFTFDPNDIT